MAPSASSPASPRNIPATSTRSTWSTRRTRRTASSGSATAGSAPYLPEEVAKHYDQAYYDPDALHVTTRVLVSPFGYNTNLVKKEDAPKSFADLLDPKWAGKMVKAHPAYSGTIMNATFQIARDLGWEYLEKLARAARHAGAVGDRHAEEDFARRTRHHDRRRRLSGDPLQGGRPAGRDRLPGRKGTPVATSPSAIFKAAPNPNAARLFQNWMHSREGQQMLVDYARQYSPHAQTVEKPGVRPLKDIKLMKEDPAATEAASEEVKTRYAKIFKV